MSTEQLPGDVAELLSRFNDPSTSTRGLAARMLAEQIAYAGAIVPVLRSVLTSDSDAYVRASAALAIARLAPTDRTGVANLVQLLHHEDADGRWAAASFLHELGNTASEALPEMVKALRDSSANVRFHAAGYVAQFAPASAIAIPDLISLLQDEDNDVQEQAATAIGNLALAGYRAQLAPAVPILLGLISNAATQNRPLFMHVVCDISPGDPVVHETIAGLLGDEDYGVRHNAELLLGMSHDSDSDSPNDDYSDLSP